MPAKKNLKGKGGKKLETRYKIDLIKASLKLFGVLGAALITAITISLVNKHSSGNNEAENPSPVEISDNPGEDTHDESQTMNRAVFDLLEQLDNEKNRSEKQRLLTIVLDLLKMSREKSHTEADTNSLFAKANSINYEMLGDQHSEANDLYNAIIYYRRAIDELKKFLTSQDISFNDNDVEKSLSRLENKIENIKLVNEFYEKFSLETIGSRDDNYIYMLEIISVKWAEFNLWKNAIRWNVCLFRQTTTGERRKTVINNLQQASNMWEFPDDSDFLSCISTGSVRFIVNGNNVKFRQEPSLIKTNIIRELELYEEGQVVQRSDSKYEIGNVDVYWYRVKTSDGTIGWVYGQYLIFYPI